MNESDAKAAFRAMGIPRPSRCLIDAWLRAAELEQQLAEAEKRPAEHAPVQPSDTGAKEAGAAAPHAQPTVSPAQRGKSLLEPVLREQNALQEPYKRRQPGRPRIVASWFPAVAATMADGTTLRGALAINGLSLSANEMRALYRNKTFQALYQEARRRYLIENWGRRGPSLRAVLGRCL
jgi:hypothetical protein